MAVNVSELSVAVGHKAAQELDEAWAKIRHCVDQLDDGQLWWRPAESMNSIANLMLHLVGNVRQWIESGIGGVPDVRQRQQEFDDRNSATKEELVKQLEATVSRAKSILTQVAANELLRERRIQGFQVNGVHAIIGCVAHFRGHAQEIVHLTRSQLGDAYRFDFVPATVEQGAPKAADRHP